MTLIEKEIVAKLPENPAYRLLIDVLDNEVKNLEIKMSVARNNDEALWAIHEWRSLKKVVTVLKTNPEEVETEIEDWLKMKEEVLNGEYMPPIMAPKKVNFPFQYPLEDLDV